MLGGAHNTNTGKEVPYLQDVIDINPEGGNFYAYFPSKNEADRFLETLCPIFKDLALLEKYVLAADKDLIDD